MQAWSYRRGRDETCRVRARALAYEGEGAESRMPKSPVILYIVFVSIFMLLQIVEWRTA